MPVTETLTLKVDTKVKQALIDSLKKIGTEGKKGAKAADDLSRNIKKVSPAPLNRLATAANKANGGLLNMVKNTTLMGYNLQGIVLVAVNKLRASFVDMTDQFNRVIGQMEKFSGSTERAVELTFKLQDITVDTGWDLDDLSSTFTKLGVSLKQFGKTEEDLLEVTRGLGLRFRQMGDEGRRLPKIAGQLATVFTSATVQFTKFDGLLGRGKAEQLFRDIADELRKIEGVNIAVPIERGGAAMAAVQQAYREGAVSTNQLADAIVRVAKEGNNLSPMATEIGHGYDKMRQAVKLIITQFDYAAGGSNSLASILSHLAHTIQSVAKHMNTIIGVASAMAGAIAGLGLVVVAGNIALVVVQLLRLVKALGLIKGAIQLVTLAMAKNPLTFFFVAATTALIVFRDEVNNLAKRLVKWIEGLKETLGILYGPIKWIVDGLAAVAQSIGLIGKDVSTKGGRGGKPGEGDQGTSTGGSKIPQRATPAQVGPAYQQYLTLQQQQRNLEVSQAAGRETPKEYTKQLAEQNEAWRKLLRTQAVDLQSKPVLTAVIKDNIKATQSAADAYKENEKILNLGSTKALEGFDNKIKNMNAALANGDITAEEYSKKAVELNTAVNNLKVSHADEINQYQHIKVRVDEVVESTERHVKSLQKQKKVQDDAIKAADKMVGYVTKLLGDNGVLTVGIQEGYAAFKSAQAKKGSTLGGSLSEGLSAAGMASIYQATFEIAQGVINVASQTKPVHPGVKFGLEAADVLREAHREIKNIQTAKERGDLSATDAKQRAIAVEDRIREYYLANIDKFDEYKDELSKALGEKKVTDLGQKGDSWLQKGGKMIAALVGDPFEKTVHGSRKAVYDPFLDIVERSAARQADEERKKKMADQSKEQVSLLREQLAIAKKQLDAQLQQLQRERDAAILEARLQAQAARDTIATGTVTREGVSVDRRGSNVNVNLNFQGDIGSAVDQRLTSDTATQATLNTVYENADEIGQFTAGGQVA